MTGELIKSYGLKPDIEAVKFVGEALLDAVKADPSKEKKIFLPHSNLTRPELLQAYKDAGELYSFVVYENTLPEKKADFKDADYALFTASSTVENFITLYGKDALKKTKVISIGDITSKTIKEHGLNLYGQAEEASIDSLIKFLMEDTKNENA